MNVAVALLAALTMLPPMLVWAEKRGWVTRGLLKDDAEPLHRGPAARATPSPPPRAD